MAFAAPASAAVVTFDFSGVGGLQAGNSMVFGSGGITFTAIAGATPHDNEYNISSRIGQYDGGLGNTTSYQYDDLANGPVIVSDDSHEVDDHRDTPDHGVREFITLDFNGLDVTLLGVEFGAHDVDDDAEIQIKTSGEPIYTGGESLLNQSDLAQLSGSIFDFIAFGSPLGSNDWLLKSVTFQYEDGSNEPDPVPEPATLALLGAGLAGFALIRRRKAA